MANRAESQMIKNLMNSDGWNELLRILGREIDLLLAEPIAGSNEFETLRTLHIRDGKVTGLKEFFDKLERRAFDN